MGSREIPISPVLQRKKIKMRHSSSFRDPEGFVFRFEETIRRQVNHAGADNYMKLMSSGLYDELCEAQLLIPHKELESIGPNPDECFRVIEPKQMDFISYPYEWSFSMLKDAAMATLRILQTALRYGMILKDASAFNIQFDSGRPLLIDTLSFETVEHGRPWKAYGQFCRHFVAPLSLAAHGDARLLKLLSSSLDGIPVDLASRLLPIHTRFSLGLQIHIFQHAKKGRTTQALPMPESVVFSSYAMDALIDNLSGTCAKLDLKKTTTTWGQYYSMTNYSPPAFEHKRRLLFEFAERSSADRIVDLAANDGTFSDILSNDRPFVLAPDSDVVAVDAHYRRIRGSNQHKVLPLCIDVTNPSASVGWCSNERESFLTRVGADNLVVALAIVHHLAIGNNLSLSAIASFFARMAAELIVEFVPKSDSQVIEMLSRRVDLFPNYDLSSFLTELRQYFEVEQTVRIKESERYMIFCRKK